MLCENDLRYIVCCLRKKNSLCSATIHLCRRARWIRLNFSLPLSLSHTPPPPLLHPPSRFVNVESKKHFGSNDTVTRCGVQRASRDAVLWNAANLRGLRISLSQLNTLPRLQSVIDRRNETRRRCRLRAPFPSSSPVSTTTIFKIHARNECASPRAKEIGFKQGNFLSISSL